MANKAFAVRRRRVSSTASWQRLPSVFFNAASEALAIQEPMGTGMWPAAFTPTTLWRVRDQRD